MKERRPIRWLVIEAEMDHVLAGGPGATFRGRFPGAACSRAEAALSIEAHGRH
jgi:hypothetical protein